MAKSFGVLGLIPCLLIFACSDDSGQKMAVNDLSAIDAGDSDLAVEETPDLAAADLVSADLTLVCADEDHDGRSPTPGCGELDCDDHNPNVWAQCATCVDQDGDKHFVGCDAYVTVRADCNDTLASITSSPEILGDGIDQDCDETDGPAAGDSRIIYVSDSTGDDASAGTRAMPVKTLDHAIALALASKVGPVAQRRFIFLATGSYTVGGGLLSGGISIYGGFDPATWSATSVKSDVTATTETGFHFNSGDDGDTLQRVNLTVPSGGDTNYGVEGSGATTVVDCQIQAGSATQFVLAIYSATSPLTVINSVLSAGPGAYVDAVEGGQGGAHISGGSITALGNGTIGGRAYAVSFAGNDTDHLVMSGVTLNASGGLATTGVHLRNGVAELTGNTITADAAPLSSAQVMGIDTAGQKETDVGNHIIVRGSANCRGYNLATVQRSVLVNNTVLIPTDAAGQIGVFTYKGGADLINNTVIVPDGNFGVEIVDCDTGLYNNLVIAGSGGGGTAVSMQVIAGTPTATLINNALFASFCGFAAVAGCADGTLNACSWTGCDAASGNLAGNCGVTAADFHLPGASACKSAGTDPSAVYSAPFSDLDGTARPQGAWDIGADEVPN